MNKTILAVSVALTTLLAAGGVTAYHYEIWDKNELKGSFCSRMNNEKLYSELKVENYATLIPGKDGWIFRTGNDFRTDWALKPQTIAYLTELRDALKQKNVDIVYVMPPIRGMVHSDELFRRYKSKYEPDPDQAWSNYEAMLADLRKKGLYVAGVRPDQATDNFFYKRDHHWTSEGARITAENVAAVTKTLPTYSQIPKMEFETVEKEPIEYDSSFGKAFRKMCDTGLPTEVIKPYETIPKGGTADQASLFDESGNDPRVILLGTSNSVQETSQANFEGFLKQNLSADVLNMSFVGAGIDTSIMSFVNSDRMKDGQPKIVLWEIPGYYDLNVMDDKLFNQLIPAAHGSCASNSLYSSHIALKEGSNQIANMRKVTGGIPSYVHLSFSQPVTNRFSLNFQFSASGAKKQQFDRFDGYKADGEFYTLFPTGVQPAEWRGIYLYAPKALAGKEVNVEVCGEPQAHAAAVAPVNTVIGSGTNIAPPVPPVQQTMPRQTPASPVQDNAAETRPATIKEPETAATAPEPPPPLEKPPESAVAVQPSPAPAPMTSSPPAMQPVVPKEASVPPEPESYMPVEKDTIVAKYRDPESEAAKTGVEWVIKTP